MAIKSSLFPSFQRPLFPTAIIDITGLVKTCYLLNEQAGGNNEDGAMLSAYISSPIVH